MFKRKKQKEAEINEAAVEQESELDHPEITARDWKKLSRLEMLDIMIARTKESEGLAEEKKALLARIAELEKEITDLKLENESRELNVERAGTLAEASMKLSGIFEAADTAAALHIENIQRIERKLKSVEDSLKIVVQKQYNAAAKEIEEKNRRIEEETRAKAAQVIKEAESKAKAILEQAEKEAAEKTGREQAGSADSRASGPDAGGSDAAAEAASKDSKAPEEPEKKRGLFGRMKKS